MVSVVLNLLNTGVGFYAFSRFLPTLIDAFDTSTAAIAGVASVLMLVAGLAGPLVGKLTDSYGPKKVIVLGAVVAAAAFMLLSLARAVWHLYVLYAFVGLGLSAAGFIPASVAISHWFVKRRGLAMGISTTGMSIGAMLISPLTGYLIESIGWRGAFLVLGIMTAVFIILPIVLVMRSRPEDMGLLPDGADHVEADTAAEPAATTDGVGATGDREEKWTPSRAFRTPSYWLLLLAFFLSSMVVAGVLQNEVNFLTVMGIPMATATFALGFTGGMGGVGKLAFGFLADRLNPRGAAIVCFAMQLVGVVVLIMTHSPAMVWVFVFVYGFSMGGNVAVQPLVTGQLFGIASFGAVFGWVALAGAVGSSVGPVLGGAIYDISGSYAMAFVVFLVVYALATVAILLARSPRMRKAAHGQQ